MAALSEIEKLEARYLENPDGRFFAPLADAYRKAGQVDRALEVVLAGLKKHPDYLSAHIVLGRCQMDRKDDGAARAAFERVLELDSENIIALKSLAEITERGGDTLGARRWLMRLLSVDAMNTEAEADLTRLGGPVVEEGEGAAEAPVEVFQDVSFADVLPPETASAAVPITEADTVPIPAVTPAMMGGAPEPPAPVAEPPLAFEPTAMEVGPAEPVPPLREFESGSFQAPSEELPRAPELEPMAYEPPPAEVVAAEPIEGLGEFDDQLHWGVGERQSRAIHAEDIIEAERVHEETSAPIAFLDQAAMEEEGHVEAVSPFDETPVEPAVELPADIGYELPARSTGAIEVDLSGMEEPPSAGTETASLELPADELPLILPEEVTPPEELLRPSQKQVETVSPAPEPVAAVGSASPMVTETMGDLYLRQGMRTEAAEVYRQLLEQRPDEPGLRAKLDAIDSPPAMSAAALGVESVGSFLRRIARASLAAPTPSEPPPPPEGPSPMDTAFEASEPEPAPVSPPAAAETPVVTEGAPARPATDAFSLDQIFGTQPPPAPSPPAPAPAPAPAPGSSFDEFFGTAPAAESVRPRAEESRPARLTSEDDLSAFTAWLHGLKR